MIPPRDRFEEIKQARIKVIKRWHSSKYDQMIPELKPLELVSFPEFRGPHQVEDTIEIKRTMYDNRMNILQIGIPDINIYRRKDKEEYTKELLYRMECELMKLFNDWQLKEIHFGE